MYKVQFLLQGFSKLPCMFFLKFKGIRLKKFVQSGGENMVGVEDNSVDAVISSELLCSVDDADKILEEIIRVLKPVS